MDFESRADLRVHAPRHELQALIKTNLEQQLPLLLYRRTQWCSQFGIMDERRDFMLEVRLGRFAFSLPLVVDLGSNRFGLADAF